MNTEPAISGTTTAPRTEPVAADVVLAAYTELRASFDALPAASLERVNVDLARTVARALAAAERLAPLRPQLATLFPEGDPVARLTTHAYALLFTDRACRGEARGATLAALAAEVRTSRARLRAVAGMLAAWGHLGSQVAHDLGRARSARGMAADVVALVRVLREHVEAVEALTVLRSADLERAAVRAGELLGAMAQATRARKAERASARRERQRAFTALVRWYERVRNAVGFVRSAAGDVAEWMPGLRSGRRG